MGSGGLTAGGAAGASGGFTAGGCATAGFDGCLSMAARTRSVTPSLRNSRISAAVILKVRFEFSMNAIITSS
jgi:hypothetical protein